MIAALRRACSTRTLRGRWRVLAAVMVAQAGSSALTLGIPALGPHLRGEFGLSLAGLGLVLTAPTAGYCLTTLLWGRIADRVGERWVIAVGLAGSAGLLSGASTAGSATALMLWLFAAGALGACAPAASGRAVAAWFAPEQRGLALSMRHTAPMVGGAIGAAVLPVAAAVDGTRGAMLALAAFSAIGALAAAAGVRGAPGYALVTAAVRRAARAPFRDRLIWTIALGCFLVIVAQAALLRFQTSYLHDERGWSSGAAGALLSVTLLGSAAARVVAGVVSDRRGRRIGVLRGQAIGAGFLLAGAATFLWLPSPIAATLLVGATVLTMAGNGVAYAAVAEAAPERTGEALGLHSTALIVGVTATPPLFGAVAGHIPWTAALLLLAAFPLMGAIALHRALRLAPSNSLVPDTGHEPERSGAGHRT